MTANLLFERGGAGRSSSIRTVLFFSADAERRTNWAKYLGARGMRTLRCVGPLVLCALLDRLRRCPLQDEADLALYDRDSLTAELRERLVQTPHVTFIAVAEDRIASTGAHEPYLVEGISPLGRNR